MMVSVEAMCAKYLSVHTSKQSNNSPIIVFRPDLADLACSGKEDHGNLGEERSAT